ncbi:MAG: FAD-binding oxidoreductase [Candidatus Taylorbacteria bacterium]|nr:FAD-binding oxidoreductase [Candidatus Taylorbacteria bacterium]
MNLAQEIKALIGGDTDDSPEVLKKFSRDASLFEVMPKIVVFPKDAQDIKAVVKWVSENKKNDPSLSITARAAGTDMSGAAVGESIILDTTRYMHGVLSLSETEATVLPGTFYRDFEVETLKKGAILPCYTASKNLNALGGMVGNNCAGEKTLKYGKMENYVRSLKIVLRDGNEYAVRPLSKPELEGKMAQRNVEGEMYRSLYDLIIKNEDKIQAAKPRVSKNSAGYYLWNVWDGKTFDLCKLIVGSQGTFGIVTEITVRLVPVKKLSKLFVVFMPTLDRLGDIVNDILPFGPESLESYDDSTMDLAVKFMPDMMKNMKPWNFMRLAARFLPEAWMALTGGMPKLVLLVEFSGDDEAEIDSTIGKLEEKIRPYGFKMRRAKSEADSEKYWIIRRESFNLLRKHVTGRRTAPFVDDVVVRPESMPEFLPKMRKILDDYKLWYTIAGHAGNGNFHIIPLMDMTDPSNARAIAEVSDKIYDLVVSYKGSITAEHNDGIVRTPYLEKMYGPEIVELFRRTKDIFDPANIFNPGKKVGGTKEYMMSRLVRS